MSSKLQEQTFIIKGMDCAGCAKSVETGISQLADVSQCSLNFTTERLRVQGNIAPETIINRVRDLGFEVADTTEPNLEAETPPQARNFIQFMWQGKETRWVLLGAIFILPALIFVEIAQQEHPFFALTSLLALILAGGPVFKSAWRVLRVSHQININVLMSIAAVGAVIIGAYTEAGMVMVLFALGEALEGYTSNRARQSIRSLMEVVPSQAMRLHPESGQEEHVPVADLAVGDLILVKPGEAIPMDGLVRTGASTVNQAAITGESKPVDKAIGAEVFASSLNGEGVLEIEVTHLAQDNTISRMITLVEEAQEKQAPSQRFIDKFAAYYTPAVVVLAALVALVPPVFFGLPFWNPSAEAFGWFYRGLTILVIACPCALVISTPVSIISAISNAAQSGVLVKGGVYLEALSRVQAIAFDKTGTLTAGKPSVVHLRSVDCLNGNLKPKGDCLACEDVLALASAVERRSEHPLASAIINEASLRQVGQKYPAANGVQAIVGQGISGQVAGRQVFIGNHFYFDESIPHSQADCESAQVDTEQGYTPLMVEADGQYLGTITVADQVRESSQAAVAQLKEIGLNHLVMLTGDEQNVAQNIAAQVGVTEVKAHLLPVDKVSAVQSLQATYGSVAMVGDGINDAPALATADVGLAVGGAFGGTAQAMETADITLMNDDLRQLPFAIRLSKAAMRTIYVNVFLSIAIKFIFLVLVLFGVGTMWMAVLADMGTSLLVTLNGMRLARYR